VPFFEPALDRLVPAALRAGRLTFTTDLDAAIRQSDIVFICVGTPSSPDGGLDLSAVEAVVRRVATAEVGEMLLVEKSTVTAQTGTRIEQTLAVYARHGGARVEVASNPEFLREGSAVHDFMRPDRIVLGVRSAWAEDRLRQLYEPILQGTAECPAHDDCQAADHVPVLVTNVQTAELIKHASNAFLATKISFVNAVADICDRIGANVRMVAEGMGLDPRIGRHFLQAGIGYGGSCFPKDVAAFVRFARQVGADFGLLEAVVRTNGRRVEIALDKLRDSLWILRGKRVGLLGLAFKPHTDDIREAPAMKLAGRLLEEGVEVVGFDPQAMPGARTMLPALRLVDDPYEVATDADGLILTTEWPELLALDWDRLKRAMRRPLILDARNALDPGHLRAAGFEYLGMGTA
jgi:UDPglucose 6-dehydrogenase